MIEIILSIGVIAFIVYAAFSIASSISLNRMSVAVHDFVKRTNDNVNGALVELKSSLENIRKITGDVSALAEEIRKISYTVTSLEKGMEKGIWNLYGYVKDGVGSTAEANIAGLKAGIKTGVVTLVKNLREKKEG